MEKKRMRSNYRSVRSFFGFFIIVSFILFGLFLIGNISAQTPGSMDQINEKADDIQEKVNKAEEIKEKIQEGDYGKWNYLGKEWKKIFLDNKYVNAVDNFLRKISLLFFVLFGENYSLSVGLAVIIFFWFYFLFRFAQLIRDFSPLSGKVSLGIGFCLVVALAHVNFFSFIVEGIAWVIFSPEAVWLRFLIFLGFCVLMVVVTEISKRVGKYAKKMSKKDEDSEAKLRRKSLKRYTDYLFRRNN